MFKKIVKAFTSKDKTEDRTISNVSDLRVGDIVTFKQRSELPFILQGVDAEVTGLGCYEYSDENEKELTLKTTRGDVFHLALVDDDGERYLSLSKKLASSQVSSLFEEDNFSLIFDEENFATDLVLQNSHEDDLAGWLDDNYSQTMKNKQGFYHQGSEKPSGTGQEFLSHYCEAENDAYGLQIEIWQDGATDIFATCDCSEDVIQDFWPSSN